MTRGWSLHIGLNAVSPAAYQGWDGELNACEYDALDMAWLCSMQGLSPTLLKTRHATRGNVLRMLRGAAARLQAGDLYVLTYSGHGGQVPDITADEPDRMDETWCLYDGEMLDDEIYRALNQFAAGVRILVLSDSCHSGSVTRLFAPPPRKYEAKLLPPEVASETYLAHRDFYDQIQRDMRAMPTRAETIKAAVILISGCQDNQVSYDGEFNGAFTEQVLRVWNRRRFSGDYRRFHEEIQRRMSSEQSPNLLTHGPAAAFMNQRPFTK